MDDAPWSTPVWWRLAARLVDAVALGWLVAVVLVEIDQRLLGGDPLGRSSGRVEVDDLRSGLLLAAAVVLYEVFPVVRYGATLGKVLFGMRVVDRDGSPVGVPAAVLRAVVLYGAMAVVPAALALVWVVLALSFVLHPWRRGLHDLVAGTQVAVVATPGDLGHGDDDRGGA